MVARADPADCGGKIDPCAQKCQMAAAHLAGFLHAIPTKRKSRSKVDNVNQIAEFVTTNCISIFIAIAFHAYRLKA